MNTLPGWSNAQDALLVARGTSLQKIKQSFIYLGQCQNTTLNSLEFKYILWGKIESAWTPWKPSQKETRSKTRVLFLPRCCCPLPWGCSPPSGCNDMDKPQICSHPRATSSSCRFWHMHMQQPKLPCMSPVLVQVLQACLAEAPSLTCFTMRNPHKDVCLFFEGSLSARLKPWTGQTKVRCVSAVALGWFSHRASLCLERCSCWALEEENWWVRSPVPCCGCSEGQSRWWPWAVWKNGLVWP